MFYLQSSVLMDVALHKIGAGGGGVGDVSGVSKVKSWSGGEMLLEVLNESRMFLP